MPIQLRTDTSAAEHNLRKSWPCTDPRAFRRLHEVFADHTWTVGRTQASYDLNEPLGLSAKGSKWCNECERQAVPYYGCEWWTSERHSRGACQDEQQSLWKPGSDWLTKTDHRQSERARACA